jgi:hypothetical protein
VKSSAGTNGIQEVSGLSQRRVAKSPEIMSISGFFLSSPFKKANAENGPDRLQHKKRRHFG